MAAAEESRCGMQVRYRYRPQDETRRRDLYFCSRGCLLDFQEDPGEVPRLRATSPICSVLVRAALAEAGLRGTLTETTRAPMAPDPTEGNRIKTRRNPMAYVIAEPCVDDMDRALRVRLSGRHCIQPSDECTDPDALHRSNDASTRLPASPSAGQRDLRRRRPAASGTKYNNRDQRPYGFSDKAAARALCRVGQGLA